MRVALGWVADRITLGLRSVAALLVLGAAGVAMLTTGIPSLVVLGTMLGFGAGWGWAGLFNLLVVRRYPSAPAVATGIKSVRPDLHVWVVSGDGDSRSFLPRELSDRASTDVTGQAGFLYHSATDPWPDNRDEQLERLPEDWLEERRSGWQVKAHRRDHVPQAVWVGPDGRESADGLLMHYFPPGLLGLGLTALLASFMSGMAGNVTAFNTVWTYDIYQSYISPGKSDRHYLRVGHVTTVVGIAFSVLAAYATTRFNNIMDMLQLVFAFVNAPLFATFLLGMFWRRTTGHGAFFGLVTGTLAAAAHHGLTLPRGAGAGIKGGFLGGVLHQYPSEMAQNFWTAIFAWTACFGATIVISLLTRRNKSDEELRGLVYSLTPRQPDRRLPWIARPATLGLFALGLTLVLNIVFW